MLLPDNVTHLGVDQRRSQKIERAGLIRIQNAPSFGRIGFDHKPLHGHTAVNDGLVHLALPILAEKRQAVRHFTISPKKLRTYRINLLYSLGAFGALVLSFLPDFKELLHTLEAVPARCS